MTPSLDVHPLFLPFVPLSDRASLPTNPCIYFVINSVGEILYIGKAGGKNGLNGR